VTRVATAPARRRAAPRPAPRKTPAPGAPRAAAPAVAPRPVADVAPLAGRYLSFLLAGGEYGLAILDVREIIGLMPINPVPRTPAEVCGVINLRGRIVPVVDLRLRLGLPAAAPTDQTVIIVVQPRDGEVPVGCVVDEVLGVLQLEAGQIEPPPDLGADPADTEFILGVGKAEQRVIFLLDLRTLLAAALGRPAVTRGATPPA
jgi:purine-binding chemotaxis protein CheW